MTRTSSLSLPLALFLLAVMILVLQAAPTDVQFSHLRDFFQAMPSWKLEPHPELTGPNALCLVEPGSRYVLCFQHGSSARVEIAEGDYSAKWFNPRAGDWIKAKPAAASSTSVIRHHELVSMTDASASETSRENRRGSCRPVDWLGAGDARRRASLGWSHGQV